MSDGGETLHGREAPVAEIIRLDVVRQMRRCREYDHYQSCAIPSSWGQPELGGEFSIFTMIMTAACVLAILCGVAMSLLGGSWLT